MTDAVAMGAREQFNDEIRALVRAVLEHADRDRWAERLFDRDPTLWTTDPAVGAAIVDRLGWLDAPEHFGRQVPALEGFGDGLRVAGFRTAVVMGMGGSSLAPEVLVRTFGTTEGYLDLRILDSTDPEAVAAAVDDLDPLSTLWIVASKSGTTTEPLAFLADARARVEAALESAGSDQRPGEFLVAITDPGKSLEAIPDHDELREWFLNPPDIGGRYAALSYVGLVPASIIGLDLDALLASAGAMLAACREPDPEANPGLRLGAALGELARTGRDKLTFVCDPAIASFGAWLEQLIAESTGKAGVGIVPIDGEPLAAATAYGRDRVFVGLSLAAASDPGEAGRAALLDALAAADHPVIRIELADPIDLGGEFVRWEVATAVAGAVLGIDPFDQPNVEEAKERTREILRAASGAGEREAGAPEGGPSPGGVVDVDDQGLVARLRSHLARRRPDGYVAIQAFIAPGPQVDASIAAIRQTVLERTGAATTTGYGPRFLHSTGQLHKGGTPSGCFLQLTSEHRHDRAIPGWPYTFGRLIDAQADGDLAAITAHDLPILRVRLGADTAAGLARLAEAVAAALG